MSGSPSPDELPASNDNGQGLPAPKSRRFMRKSCHFCRSRKIKCSGHMICEACRERNLECFYSEGEPKGRPKNKSKDSFSGPSSKGQNEQPMDLTDATSLLAQLLTSDASHSYQQSPIKQAFTFPTLDKFESNKPLWVREDSVAAQMIGTFLWLDLTSQSTAVVPTNPVDKKIFLIRDCISKQDNKVAESFGYGQFSSDLSYEDVFFTIAQELIELLAVRLGEIGCSDLGDGRSQYFLKSFIADTTTTMFDPYFDPRDPDARTNSSRDDIAQRIHNPLSDYDNHEMPPMLEIWFSQHPFSFMFSKTLLLRDVRKDTYDDILIAAMLGDVLSSGPTDAARHRAQILYSYANMRLGSTSRSDIQLTTCQAMVLLGWHALCTGQARRGLVLLAWADNFLCNVQVSKVGINIVNGVDVGEVESESLRSTQWLLYSIFLWIIMQVQMSSRDFLPWDVPAILPTADPNELAMLRLDQSSGSFSTLQSQEGAYRELWLLSHVTAFVSQIYRLCPRVQTPTIEVIEGTEGWQSQVLKRLRSLSSPIEDILNICTQVRHVLHDVKLTMNTQTQALELLVAHTVLIHLLVPSLAPGPTMVPTGSHDVESLGARRVIAAGGIHTLLDEYCTSVRVLLQVFGVLRHSTPRTTMSQRMSTKGSFILLALDACVRGLHCLWSLRRFGTDTERLHLTSRQTELQSLATELHFFGKRLLRVDAVRLGSVIEQLEIVMCYLNGVEIEDYSDIAWNSGESIGQTTASTVSSGRIPSSDCLGASLMMQSHGIDVADPSAMDFMGGEMWATYAS